MQSLDPAEGFMDDLLDFSSDIGEEEEEEDDEGCEKTKNPRSSPSLALLRSCSSKITPLFPNQEFVEEELEWISNKDAFPMVESFVDIMPSHPSIATAAATTTANHQSPVSVLDNSSSSINSAGSHGSSTSGGTSRNASCAVSALISSFKVPGKSRSKQVRKRRKDMSGQRWHCWAQQKVRKPSSTIGRKCLHCQAEKTPQWRAGPLGPKTLCNACGVRYKSGRLVPEYRPASSPTFSSVLHSNSHRKIVEMRKQKMMTSNIGVKNAGIS